MAPLALPMPLSFFPKMETTFIFPSILFHALSKSWLIIDTGGDVFESWRDGDLPWPKRVAWRPSIRGYECWVYQEKKMVIGSVEKLGMLLVLRCSYWSPYSFFLFSLFRVCCTEASNLRSGTTSHWFQFKLHGFCYVMLCYFLLVDESVVELWHLSNVYIISACYDTCSCRTSKGAMLHFRKWEELLEATPLRWWGDIFLWLNLHQVFIYFSRYVVFFSLKFSFEIFLADSYLFCAICVLLLLEICFSLRYFTVFWHC